MIPEEMLRRAATKSSERYVASLEQGYEPGDQHVFSPEFERSIKRLKRRADHPLLYRMMQRAASIALAVLLTGGAYLTVNVEARAVFLGWVKEVYETVFVYRFFGEVEVSERTDNYEPSWIPEGYTKFRELVTDSRISIIYRNQNGQFIKLIYYYNPSEIDAYVDLAGGTVTTVQIEQFEADLILVDDPDVANGIMWTDDNNCAFLISAYLSEDDLIKLAKSIYR